MGAPERGTYLARAIVHTFVKNMDMERKQIFTETGNLDGELYSILIHFFKNGRTVKGLLGCLWLILLVPNKYA